MSDEKNTNGVTPAIQQLADMFISILGPTVAAMVENGAPDPNVVNISMTREAFEKQRAELAELDQLRKKATDLSYKLEVANSKLDVAEKQLDAAQKRIAADNRQLTNTINANRQYAKQLAALQGQLNSAGSSATRAEYNKLWKQHTACVNQRNSFANTIGVQKQTIDELNATIAELKKQPQTPCAVLVIDSVTYTPDEVRKIVTVSADRAVEIERLRRDLNTMTSLRDSAVKAGEEIKKDMDQLRSQAMTYYYNGSPVSPDTLKHFFDLGVAAENAGYTQASFQPKTGHFVTQQTPERDPKPIFSHRRKVNEDGDKIVIYDPENVTLRIVVDNHTELTVEASLLPQMVQDIQAARSRADRMEGDLAKCMERNNTQAVSLRAAEREMDNLRKTIDGLNKRVGDKDADIQRLTIERNLIRGQLNELRALKAPATVNGQVLQAGEAYMTTALGMLPINSEGMRKLSDALDAYRAKVASLTNGLREWMKT